MELQWESGRGPAGHRAGERYRVEQLQADGQSWTAAAGATAQPCGEDGELSVEISGLAPYTECVFPPSVLKTYRTRITTCYDYRF